MEITELKTALFDLLDMQGAISGDHHELSGYGLSKKRQFEIWELGQRLLKEYQNGGLQ
jgi:hypothetical protein